MSWERDGIRWWYDTSRRRPILRIRLNLDERQRTARVVAMLAGWPTWMANVEAAVCE